MSNHFFLSLSDNPFYMESLAPVAFSFFVTLMLPRLNAFLGTIITCSLVIVYLGIWCAITPDLGQQAETAWPVLILVIGYAVWAVRRLMTAKRVSQFPQIQGHVDDEEKSVSETTVGRYTLSEELARDGHNIIFQGQDLKTGAAVKIKYLPVQGSQTKNSSKVKDGFFYQMERLRQLRHPNIVFYMDYGESLHGYYIVMADAWGKEIKYYSEKDRLLPIRDTLHVISKAADALEYAHQNHLVHQCISPNAVCLTKNSDETKVKNFENAMIRALFQFGKESSGDGHMYLSPEQVAGKKVDSRTDIFSLGIILFEMLTGAHPFSGEDITTTMMKITKEKHPSPRFFNPKIPLVVEKIIDRTLEKNLEKRYQKAGQLAVHLHRLVAKIDSYWENKGA